MYKCIICDDIATFTILTQNTTNHVIFSDDDVWMVRKCRSLAENDVVFARTVPYFLDSIQRYVIHRTCFLPDSKQ